MAGRGRGRGNMSFSVEAVGIGKGENMPPSILQPTPPFPPMEHKPVALVMSEEAEYMLALKQEFRGAMKTLPFYLRPAAPKKDVERYSDKYQSSEPADSDMAWKPDWKRLPKELRTRVRKPQKENSSRSVGPPPRKRARVDQEEVILKLETLEKKEEEVGSDEEAGEKKKDEEEVQEEEEEYDEEEFEEETDYIMSYFDNGEEFGGDSDDNMDEAIY